MSHPDPTYDPADFDGLTPEQEDDFIRQNNIYIAIQLLKHMRNDDLEEVVKGLPDSVKHRLSLYLAN